MSELMEEHDDRPHEQKGNEVTDEPMAQRIETMQKNVGHRIPLTQGQRPCPQPSRMPLRQFEARGWQLYFSQHGQRQSRRPRMSAEPDSRTAPSRSAWPRPAWRWPRT